MGDLVNFNPPNNLTFPLELNLSIQNVRSLNISTKNKTTMSKLVCCTQQKEDIILLSDTRLNSDRQTTALHDIEKTLLTLGYKLFYNSPTSSRGVAILISTKINFLLTSIRKDGWVTFSY